MLGGLLSLTQNHLTSRPSDIECKKGIDNNICIHVQTEKNVEMKIYSTSQYTSLLK